MNEQVNERLWQKWLWKNRELDKLGARRRVRFFQLLLAMTITAAVLQNFVK